MPIRPENRGLGPAARSARAAPYGERNCEICGATFTPYRRASRCCGQSCRNKAATRRGRAPKPCFVCRAMFAPKRSAKAAYCSQRCRSAAHAKAVKADPARRSKARERARIYSRTPRYRFNQANAKALRRMREREGGVTFEEWQAICARHGHRCAYCRRKRRLTMDHVKALARDGRHVASNIVPACTPCNSAKGTADWSAKLPCQ